jgi:hypothetical protein
MYVHSKKTEVLMIKYENEAVLKKTDALLYTIAGLDKFGALSDDLSTDELDTVVGGMATPDFQRFMQFVHGHNTKNNKK